MFVCCLFVGVSYASLTNFGDLLRCPHKRIVTITKVYIATNNIHVEIIRFRKKNSGFNDILKFQVEKSFATNVINLIRDKWPLVYRALVVSDDSNFDLSTALFHVTMYRHFARRVGTSANSALIRNYSPRLKLSSSTRVSEETNA